MLSVLDVLFFFLVLCLLSKGMLHIGSKREYVHGNP